MGNLIVNAPSTNYGSEVTNASRHWVHGEPVWGLCEGVEPGHKCLSALGSWGTRVEKVEVNQDKLSSQMPLGIGFMGNPIKPSTLFAALICHKCLSALGSWGTRAPRQRPIQPQCGHKCLSALGSWGTGIPDNNQTNTNTSQMPLGIGFMGNNNWQAKMAQPSNGVTNASRHWVHGERSERARFSALFSSHKCLSALGSWGTTSSSRSPTPAPSSQMPLGIGFMGNSASPRLKSNS